MRSVLDVAGFFLFLVYRVVMLPILSVLYALLAVVVLYHQCQVVYSQASVLLVQTKNNLFTARLGTRVFHKWSLNGVRQKTWIFSNHSH